MRETAQDKAGKLLTGETLILRYESRVPLDRNWITYQQRLHLLDDLAHDAGDLSNLLNRYHGWGPPKGEDLERMLKLLDQFRFSATDKDKLFEEMALTWEQDKEKVRADA